ncbi:MAG: helicase-exonuclease AddAB subunit AddA [Peptococcaceae bacterium]|nr:helicase-exonuclease AddAB subunit AddA [Peptococcaceae bacterium]
MRNWNEGQAQAINARCANLLVSASAGTGKTAVMVERLIKRLTDRQDPLEMDRFLMVTFTNAAAQEMRQRISRRLEGLIRENPGDRWLKRQQLLLGRAAISTLHAFCLELIRQNYQQLELDPQSRVLNQAEQILLKQQVLEELLEAGYAAGEADFLSLSAAFGGEKNDRPLRELILAVYEFAASQPRPLAWLEKCSAVYRTLSQEKTSWESCLPFLPLLYSRTRESLGDLGESLRSGAERCRGFSALQGYQNRLEEEGQALQALAEAPDWDDLIRLLTEEGEVFGRLPGLSAKPKKEEGPQEFEDRLALQARLKELREQVRKSYRQLREPLLGEYTQQMIRELGAMAPAMEGLAAAARDFTLAYDEAKREKAAIDFADIEHQALLLLRDSQGELTPLAESLRSRYLEILVDEYQDINPAQEEILQAVAGESFFMVGDVKQSIYGFRQAAPELFLEKFRAFTHTPKGDLIQTDSRTPGGPEKQKGEDLRQGIVIMLEENYRSSQRILEGINGLFDRIMVPEISGLDYRQEGRFTCGSPRPEAVLPKSLPQRGRGPLELHLIAKKSDRSEATLLSGQEDFLEEAADPEEEDPEALQLEALFTAKRIEELMEEEIWDDKVKLLRPLAYRDIVILLPAMANVADVFSQALQSRNIPVFADMGSGYFGAQEVQTAVSFLKVVDNPRQDIPLAALLLSPLYGFTAAELAEIRLAKKSGNLYESLVLFAWENRGVLGRRVRDWLKSLRQYRRLSREDSMEHLLLKFYQDTRFPTLAAAMAGGRQRQANLQALVQRARQFEESNMKGLYQFIRYLEALEKSGTDLSAAAVIGENEDVVRLMSIHKSKGLEFPVVFLATCGRRFNQRDTHQDVLLHRGLGLASVVLEPKKRVKYPGAYHLAVSGGLKRERLAEAQRLLYVALTRARERLILVAAPQNARERLELWEKEGLPAGSQWIFRAGSFLDWLGPGIVGAGPGRQGPGGSPWVCRLWYPEELCPRLEPAASRQALWRTLVKEGGGVAEDEYPELDRILSWQYPYQGAGGAPAKLSVTQARGRLYPEEDAEAARAGWLELLDRQDCDPPAFIAGDTAKTGLIRGTALHKLLSRIKPAEVMAALQAEGAGPGAGTKKKSFRGPALIYLEKLAAQLTASRFLSPQEASLLEFEPLLRYLESPLFARAALADAKGLCRREVSFAVTVPAGRLYPDLGPAKDDPVMIQGAIDLFFQEEESLVLVDYKTDRVRPGEEIKLLRDYRGQLKLYAEALEKLTGKPARELLIYSLALAKAIPVTD